LPADGASASLGRGKREAFSGLLTLQGFQTHEISILTGAGMLEPLGNPPANTPKYFSTESLAELRDNQKWLEKATDAISTYWRRKNGQKRAGRNGRTSPSSLASGG
jgi:hypothetical protein